MRAPTPEHPTPEQLAAYGDLAFLMLRTNTYQNVPIHLARRCIQPPIDLGFYRVFRRDGVPRAAVTWAFLGPEQEAKMVRQEALQPAEWVSGKQMWVMDIFAPYAQGSAVRVAKWVKNSLPQDIDNVRFVRIGDARKGLRFFEARRISGSRWAPRLLDADRVLENAEANQSIN